MTEMDPFEAFISNLGTRPRDETDLETVEPDLYVEVMRQQWDTVVEIYKKHRMIQATRITNSDDTALHVAITHGAPESSVLELVDEIDNNVETATQTLSAKNKRGETPLHCAASRGSLNVCRRIVRIDAGLVGERNKEGETPLFLAALNGQKQTFFYLHQVCKETGMLEKENMSSSSILWRRDDGSTILHCTIQREYFGLSLYILDQYKNQNIASSINIEGITPLHVLARKPSAFRSCTRLSWWQNLCYKYTRVEKLTFDQKSHVVDFEHSDPHHTQILMADSPAGSHQSRGYSRIRKIKEKHVWGSQIMDELITQNRDYQLKDNIESVPFLDLSDFKELEKNSKESEEKEMGDEQKQQDKPSKGDKIIATKYGLTEAVNKILKEIHVAIHDHETTGNKNIVLVALQERQTHVPSETDTTALLIATKYGLIEAVKKILNDIPVAIHDKTTENKNIVHVAVEERQSHILKLLMKDAFWLNLRDAVDVDGNNPLHLAAKLSKRTPWDIRGAAMRLQWEVKWFEFVKENIPSYLSAQTNKEGLIPEEIFVKDHKELFERSNQWLKDTSVAYTVASTLIASATFGTCYQVPGGNKEDTGKPILGGHPIFKIYLIAVLVAFCFSITSLAFFLAVYSSRKLATDYLKSLPLKLLLGLISLFVSIVSTLVSFCAAHYLEHEPDKLNPGLLYSLSLIPLFFFALPQIQLFWLLLKVSLNKVPQSRYMGADVPI